MLVDLFDTEKLCCSDAYYHDRGGRRSELHSRAAGAASEVSSVLDSRSLASLRSEHSPNQERGDARLRMQRKKWNDETAKRIHVAVRVRPMNINEIKADAKVRKGESQIRLHQACFS